MEAKTNEQSIYMNIYGWTTKHDSQTNWLNVGNTPSAQQANVIVEKTVLVLLMFR